jgi:twinkle protein
MKSRFLRHAPCPDCSSSDALSVYSDGHTYCFVCQAVTNGTTDIEPSKPIYKGTPLVYSLPASTQPALHDRKISASTVAKYRVTAVKGLEGSLGHVYPFFDASGKHVANEVRKSGEKAFYWEGDVADIQLFGSDLFPPDPRRAVTVYEGCCDAMAGFQLSGSRYNHVAVTSSASAKKECTNSFEYLNAFEKIVLCFDADEPGKKAVQEVASLFAPGKVYVVSLKKGKDANVYLMEGLEKEFVNEWFAARVYMPDGLLVGTDPKLLDDIINYSEPHCIPYPWEGLNKSVYGLRLSELTLFMADTGIGKTSFMKEIEYKLLMDKELIEKNYGVGFLHLEEPKRDVALGLMSIHGNKPYHLPDTHKTPEELTEAYNAVVNSSRVVIWDHFGSNDVETVMSKIRHMAALGCKYIFIDHLTMIVSDQSGDERKQLDELSTKLKTLTMNLGISCVCVIHINRQGQVRGSAGPEQVSNNVIRLERDKKDADEWRRNVTKLTVEKCRLSGKTGPVAWVYYDATTGRLQELTQDPINVYQEGGTCLDKNDFRM